MPAPGTAPERRPSQQKPDIFRRRQIDGRLQGELDHQVSLRVSSEVKFLLNMFDATQTGSANINTALQNLVSNIDVNQISPLYVHQINFSSKLHIYSYNSWFVLELILHINAYPSSAQIVFQVGRKHQIAFFQDFFV